MNYSQFEIWLIIALIAIGTFAIRFSFLGLIGSKRMAPVIERMLRFTPVAVLPGHGGAPRALANRCRRWGHPVASGRRKCRRWHGLSDPQGHLGHVSGPRRFLRPGDIRFTLGP